MGVTATNVATTPNPTACCPATGQPGQTPNPTSGWASPAPTVAITVPLNTVVVVVNTPTPTPVSARLDVDHDRDVDIADIMLVAAAWGQPVEPPSANGMAVVMCRGHAYIDLEIYHTSKVCISSHLGKTEDYFLVYKPIKHDIIAIMKNKASSGNTQLIIIILLLVLLTGLLAGGSVYFFQQAKIVKLEKEKPVSIPTMILASPTLNPVQSPQPSPELLEPTLTLAPAKSDLELIRSAFAQKYSRPENEVNVSISKNTGTHTSGSISFIGEMGGGMFLAAKVDGNWIIVHDGQGTISCQQIEPYNFPKDLVSECFDEDTGEIIYR